MTEGERPTDSELRFERMDPEMVDVLARLSGAERLEIAFGLFRSVRSMLDHHLASTHPDWSSEDRAREIARRISRGAV